ncbi:HNH endonuclease [Mycobacterium phage Cornie]|uniref:HNH endonuclease n=1 Tax=Mycobacterium phage Cornie TaxID=2704043 RepID=A0A6G6XKC0_9CAUD|nr:HNH endonuclease [Mycobacterium phage Cornie]QIG58476.1 HNH endonuclease [Mycobacterium phage Cornie]
MPSHGTTSQRGYNAQHQRERRRWTPIVQAGKATCWRCQQPIHPNQPWDLGHDDHDRSKYKGPEHIGRECPAGGNRATATRRQWRRPPEPHPGIRP